MSEARTLSIFRPGRHITAGGDTLTFSEADCAAIAASYDPARHQAPLTIGHPKDDAPAYGWVKSLQFADGVLGAVPDQVEPQFAELVNAGRFKKLSASFYPPAHPRNPAPQAYYLRHVAFLGAQPPAVKGLPDARFAADEAGVVEIEFGEPVAWPVARVLRSLREWLIAKFSPEDADRVVPDYVIQDLDAAARAQPDNPMTTPAYAEPATPTTTDEDPAMTAEQQAALKAREDAITAKEAEFAERETKIKAAEAAARRTEVAEFVEQLVKDGKVLPRDQAPLVEFMAGDGAEIAFAEGDATVKKPREEWLRGFLGNLPKQVDFAERAGTATAAAINPADAHAVAAKAVEFQESERRAGREISADAAVRHVLNAAG
ncbi:MAG: peptidase [Gammaproteobacteria bacterium]